MEKTPQKTRINSIGNGVEFRAPLLTVKNSREECVVNYLRFADLKARGVVKNWTTLARLVNEQGFPAGVRLGAQTRAWDEAEVAAWLEARRIASPAGPHRPRSFAKSNTLADATRR
jgi:Prophage CP4-57 regulatory protein (AlpA)